MHRTVREHHGSPRRWLAMFLATATVAAMLVPTVAVGADLSSDVPGPYLDQALDGDPVCDTTEFPGSRTLLSSTRTQTFQASRSDLDAVELCLTSTVAIELTVSVEGGGLTYETTGPVGPGTGFTRFVFDTAPITPGETYTLKVTGPADVGLTSNVVVWRLSCASTGTLGLQEECPDDAPDRYARGTASSEGSTSPTPFGASADFGFRTFTPGTSDLTGTLHRSPRQICRGSDVPVSASVTNAGSSDVRDLRVAAFVSTDERLDDADPSLGTVTLEDGIVHGATVRLGAGPDVDLAFPLSVPADALPGVDGRVQLLFVVDVDDAVVEGDRSDPSDTAESNNTTSAEAILTSCSASSVDSLTIAGPAVPVPAGVSHVAVDQLPVATLPFGQAGIASSPLTNNPLTNNPLTNNPLTNNPLTNNPLTNNPLHDGAGNEGSFLYGAPYAALATVNLANTPLLRPGGWPAALAGTALDGQPLQTLTLLDVMLLDPQPSPAVQWAELDLQDSGLGLTLVAAAAGATPLSDIDLPNGATWCGGLLTELGFDCAQRSITDADATLVTIDLYGVDLTDVPFDAITLDRVHLHAASPLASVALQAGDPTQEFDPRLTPWADAVVSGSLTDLVDCTRLEGGCTPTTTLTEVTDADAFVAGATVADLIGALPGAELAQATIEDAIRGTIHNAAALPIEAADLGSVLLSSLVQAGPFADLVVEIVPSSDGASLVDPTFNVTLPPRSALVPGSVQLHGPDGAAAVRNVQSAIDASGRSVVTVTTDLHAPVGVVTSLTLSANPGEVLGAFTADVAVAGTDLVGPYGASATSPPFQVVETHEPDGPEDGAASWRSIPPDTLVFGHLSSPGDTDVVTIPVPGEPSRIKIVLSHLPEDYDLLLGGPSESPLTNNPLTNNPLTNNPLTNNPLTNNTVIPEGGSEYVAGETSDSTPPETLHDLPLTNNPLTNNGVRAVSVERGRTTEVIVVETTEGEAGYLPLQISGYNLASSDRPYVLRYHVITPQRVDLGACLPVPFTPSASDELVPAPSSLDPTTNTLFLVADGRLDARFGADALQVRTALDALADRGDLGVRGVVVPIDGVRADGASNDVASAYSAWDEARCAPAAANEVAGRVRDLVLEYRRALPIEHVVVVGDDDQIPYLRIRDDAVLANEAGYVTAVAAEQGEPGAQGTPLTAALQAGLFLTDDHVGTAQPRPWLDHAAWVPDIGVGRLSGDAATIVAAIDHFVGSDGRVDPELLAPAATTVSGYDHLADGATLTADNLDAATGLTTDRLISDTWTADDLRAQLTFPTTEPVISSINGHSDLRRFLPADQNAAGTQDQLVTTDDLAAFPLGSIVMSMACHFGYDLPVGSPGQVRDWSDAVLARQGILVSNSGYNYGDTVEIAAGELFVATLASHLNGSVTVGQAIALTKAEVYAKEGSYSAEFFKAMQGMLTMGLPMYRVAGTGTTPPANTISAPVQTDPVTGLGTATIELDLPLVTDASACPDGATCLVRVEGPSGVSYTAVGRFGYRALAVTGRPVGPRVVLDVTGLDPAGRRVHGAEIVAATSVDVPGIDAAWARAIVDGTDTEPEVEAEGTIFPIRPTRLVTVDTPSGERQYLTVLPWTLRTTSKDATGRVLGDLRLDTSLTLQLHLSDAGDNRPAQIDAVEARRQGDNVQVTTEVAPVAGQAVRSSAFYRDELGAWHRLALTSQDGLTWVGSGTLPGTSLEPIELLVEVVDEHGDVAYWRNKGDRVPVTADAGELPFTLAGEPGTNGWFTSSVTVHLPDRSDGRTYEVSRGGGDFEPVSGTTIEVVGDAVHHLVVRLDDGTGATDIVVAIDTSGPDVVPSAPTDGATYRSDEVVTVDYGCADLGPSGLHECTGTQAVGELLDLSLGEHTFTITALDRAGNQTVRTLTYTVLSPPLEFQGFYWPIENGVFNTFEWGTSGWGEDDGDAGFQYVPFIWRLYQDGKVVTDVSLVTGYVWQQVTCTSTVEAAQPVGEPTPVRTWRDGGVQVLFNTMYLIAHVPEAFVGTCRRFDLRLADGQVRSAWLTIVNERPED